MSKLDNYRLEIAGREYKPIVVGGMGVDISSSELALSIARLGGIGHISDAMSPYVSDKIHRTKFQSEKRKQFIDSVGKIDKTGIRWAPEVVYEAQCKHVRYTMEQKKGPGAVYVNVMEKLTMGAPAETLKARLQGAMDSGVDGITLSAGLHTGSLKLIENNPRFRDVQIGIIASSARALKIFLRSASRVNRLPDYVVVEGPLAGGHLGFGLDWQEFKLKNIVTEVLELLRSENLSIPVIPAGGIFSGSDAVECLQMGGSAVQVATRFTISEECGLPSDIKQKYLDSSEEDVVVNMVSPTGYPMRMLKSSPCLTSNVAPNCEALGYILDKNSQCCYHESYENAACGDDGKKLPITDRMCICYHFMKYNCYTCGHYVYRLKDTTSKLPSGEHFLPSAEHIFNDYLYSTEHNVDVAKPD